MSLKFKTLIGLMMPETKAGTSCRPSKELRLLKKLILKELAREMSKNFTNLC